MIDDLDNDVCRYLSAVEAIAIYIATVDGVPVRVGFAHDPRKTKVLLVLRWPRLTISWLAWFDDSKDEASRFIDDITDNIDDMLIEHGIARPLAGVIARIERLARIEGLTLTPHRRAVERAKASSVKLDEALAKLKSSGELSAFNHAYRAYRQERVANGESAMPYWAAQQALRRLIIQHLVRHKNFFARQMLSDIRQHFPWFRARHDALQ
jgi:hypothetical protein